MVDVNEAARLVGRNPETVRRWVWTGRVAAVKFGNKMLIRRDVLVGLGSLQAGSPSDDLASWAARARNAHGRGRPGATASDLVLADRASREGASAHAGG